MALEIQFKQLGTDKFRLLGDDGNEFDTAEEAWKEAQNAANLGIPWGGASFRLVDNDAVEHSDDCPIGLGRMNACDCGAARVVEERRLFPPEGVVSRYSKEAEAIRAIPGAIVDGKLRLSSTYGSFQKLQQLAGGRALKQLESNAGYGKTVVVEGVLEPKDEEKGGA